MINWFATDTQAVYDYVESHKNARNDRYIFTGVDTFDYESYPLALCDHASEAELVALILQEKYPKKPWTDLSTQVWVQNPRSSIRRQLV